MARYVKVASIPAALMQMADTRDYEAVVQAEIAYWGEQIKRVTFDGPDLIVTPECCDHPAGMSGDTLLAYYQVRGDRLRDFFAGQARKYACNIAYSAHRTMPDGTLRNAMQMLNRQGGIDGAYHKYMLTIRDATNNGTLYGKDCHAIETDIGRICGAICFDLNFEAPLRLVASEKPDITLFPSLYHGGYMQRHWAYMTCSYLITCVAAGETAAVINPVGEVIAQSTNYYRHLYTTINLDYKVAHLDHNWEKFDAMKDKYGERVEMCTPYGLGCSLLTCKDESLTMAQIVDEFEIELWDDYYARSVAARHIPGRIEP